MKLLSFSYCFPNALRPTWGVFVLQRLAALAELVELEVVSPAPTFPLVGLLLRRGGRQEPSLALKVYRPGYFYIPGILKHLDARFYARGLRRWVAGYCRAARPDIFDAHFIWPDGVGVSILAGELGIPFAITLRGWLYQAMQNRRMLPQCVEAMRQAAAIISVSGHLARTAIELGVPADKLHVIPNGVDLERFRPGDKADCRKELGLPADGRLIVTVAHLGARKGHHEALQALSKLPADVRLAIVGGDTRGGGDEQQLRELAAKLGVEGRLILPGRQPYERIPKYFQAADASLLASWREGCPNAVLESLACGTPTVATSVGAVPDLVEPDINGRVVPVRDAEALAAALAAVLDRPWRPEAIRGTKAVKSWRDVADEVHRVFLGVLGCDA